MEQSIHNLASPKPDNGIGTVDTPRTSNLKFLRAKRLSYFCGKSVQSHLSNIEETKCVGIQKNQQHTVAQTPRRSCSAPTSKREQSVSLACNAHKRANLKANISSPDEAIHLQGAEETSTLEPATPQILQRNPGKKSTSELPGHHSVPSENEGKTKDSTNRNNLRKAPEKSWANKSIHDSLQQAPAKSNPLEASTQHSLQPAPKEKTTEALIHYSLQPSLGKAGSKVISTHPILQPEEKETTIMEFPTCSNPQYKPEKARTKDSFTQNHLKPGPGEAERNIPSTHRSLLRSSFVSDLDQDLLEDLSVPETEKLQHVMTWAKKFLNKSNGRDNLPVRESDDLLPNNMDERSVTDKYCKSNSASADSSAQYDVRVESNDYGFKKQPYLNDQCKESAPITFWVPKSPRNKFKTNSVFNQVSRATPEPDLFLSKMPVSTVSHSDHKADKDHFNKPLQIMHPQVGTNRLYKDPFRNKSSTHLIEQFVDCNESVCSDDEDIYRNGFKSNQWDCNIEASKVSESDIDKKDNFTDRVDDTSSTESSLDTERLNALLDNLGIIHKGSEKKTSSVEKDGSRTDRTFLVEKCAESVDGSAMSASIEVLDWSQPHSYRVCSNMCLSEDSTTKVYQVCPACSFFNTKITSWCSECGSFLDSDKGRALRNDTDKKFRKSPPSHESVLEDFFSVKKDIVKGLDKIPVSKQNDKECGRTVCWEEDNSDVVSDGGGSVLEKYLLYVQQLDLIRKEKEEQNKYEEECFDYMSSEDESSKEYSKPQLNHNITKTNVTNTRATNDYDNTATQFLENPNCLAKSDLCRCDQQARIENHLTASTEKSYETEASNLKGALDRKLQKATHISSSKVTGPKRYWEKSSLAWSSYTHGELKPRSHFGNQRPASAELRKKSIQGDKAIGAVSEHLCQSYWDGPSNNLQWISKGDYGSMWLLLPDELWIYIFAQLSHRDLSKVTQVCQRFRYIANDDSLWKVIRITNCHSLNDTCLVNIGLHHPESLSLYRCHDDTQNITEEGLRKLFQHCKDSLRELNVTNCSGQRFEGDIVLFNASNYCTRLTSVDISWTAATDKGIIALVEASAHLQSLSVNGCKITDHAITALLKKHCESLIKIEVFGCHTLSAKCLISMATACTHLENLNIGRIPKVTDDCLAKIASNLRKISTLNLTGVNVVRDRAVHHIVKQCSKLDNLTLSSCSQVTDVSLVEISTYLRTIKYLDLSGCKKVSDIGIQALARSCQQIRYLDLSSTGTGKRGVCLLASYCYATLECLKLSFCKEVTADAIEKLCKNCKRLKMLHLYGCRVSPDFENIKKFSKSFQIFHDLSIPTAKILGE